MGCCHSKRRSQRTYDPLQPSQLWPKELGTSMMQDRISGLALWPRLSFSPGDSFHELKHRNIDSRQGRVVYLPALEPIDCERTPTSNGSMWAKLCIGANLQTRWLCAIRHNFGNSAGLHALIGQGGLYSRCEILNHRSIQLSVQKQEDSELELFTELGAWAHSCHLQPAKRPLPSAYLYPSFT